MLTKQLPLMQSQVRGEVESVAMYMPTVHSALQRKELALYSQLADSFHQYAKPCIQAVSYEQWQGAELESSVVGITKVSLQWKLHNQNPHSSKEISNLYSGHVVFC